MPRWRDEPPREWRRRRRCRRAVSRSCLRSDRTAALRRARGLRELLQTVWTAEYHDLISGAHHTVWRRVEFHAAVGALDGHDDDAESLPQVRGDDAGVLEAAAGLDLELLHRQLDRLRTRRELHEIHDGRAQRRLGDLVGAELVR